MLSNSGGIGTLVDERVAADQKQAGQIALRAGLDVGISFESGYMRDLIESVRQGHVSLADIDRAVRRILRQKFRLGLFEKPYVDPARAVDGVRRAAHRALALEVAREGIVLLKNQGNLLPLRKNLASIAVIGPNADHDERRAPDGTNGEGKHVASLDLTGMQQELVRAVHATGTPTVVVLVNGRPLSVRWIAEHLPAIVEAWLPDEQGGRAVADILFGDVNPSGRLPVTVPSHSGQLPVYYNYRPSKACRMSRSHYVDMPTTPLFEFGHGLSYTTFAYANLRISPEQIRPAGEVEVSADVTNTGSREGAEVVQLYLDDLISPVSTPVKELKGFEKIWLKPGETRTVRFRLTPEHLSLLNEPLEPVVEPGLFEVMVGSSSEKIHLRGSFEVVP